MNSTVTVKKSTVTVKKLTVNVKKSTFSLLQLTFSLLQSTSSATLCEMYHNNDKWKNLGVTEINRGGGEWIQNSEFNHPIGANENREG